MTETHPYPEHLIDPEKKDGKWCLDYCKAAWSEWNNMDHSILQKGASTQSPSFGGGTHYDTIAMYMEGRQLINQYKPLMGVDETAQESWMNLDWSILPVMPKQIRVCNGILNKFNYNIRFQPMDQMATDQKNQWFARMRARMEVRDEIRRQAGDQAEDIIRSMGLDRQDGEPADMDELEMMSKYTWKHLASVRMQEDVSAVFAMNDMDRLRQQIRKDLLYYGIAGYRDYIDTNGALRIRRMNPRAIIVSGCEMPDFSDMQHAGELLMMSLPEFAQANTEMSDADLLSIADRFKGQYGNPASSPSTWAQAKKYAVPVLDLEWFSVDIQNWEVSETKYSNMAVVRAPLSKTGDRFTRRRLRVLYRAKWLVGTDSIFDYGLATDMKRAKAQLSEVLPNIHLIAPMMSGMKVSSIGQLAQPVLDQIQMDWLKYQKAKADARSAGYSIEMSALEDISYGRGGRKMAPSEVVELWEQRGIHLWRNKNRHGQPNGQRPIENVAGTGMEEIIKWSEALANDIQQLKDIIGLNDFTDASTPDSRSLGATVNTAIGSTNNALFDIIEADANLLKRVANSVVIRLQDMESMGLLDRYAMAIGDNSISFIKNVPKVDAHDFAIRMVVVPTEEQRAAMVELAKEMAGDGSGRLEMEDFVLINSADDMDEAARLLAWRLRRRKAESLKESLELQRQNAEVQAQSGMAVEKARQDTARTEGEIKLEVARIQAEAAVQVARIQAGARLATAEPDGDEQKEAQTVAA